MCSAPATSATVHSTTTRVFPPSVVNTLTTTPGHLYPVAFFTRSPTFHNYASLGFIETKSGDHSAHYPSIKPELVELTSALHALAHDADKRAQYVADADAYADGFKLSADQREALIKLDLSAIVRMGAHPLVLFLAQLQIQRLRPLR